MSIIYALGATAFVLCLLLTPLCSKLALRWDLVDRPDLDRKFHTKSVPRLGGVPIVLSYAGALALVIAVVKLRGGIYLQHQHFLMSLLPAGALVFATGLIDDLIGLKPWQKIVGQLAGAIIVTFAGIRLQLGSHFMASHAWLSSKWIEIPLSIAWLLICTNAVNLIDGLDGLASGVGLFATITTLLAGLFTGNTGLVLATMPLAGSLLAFLYYNFAPASIFLGDSGSLTIGFSLGCFGLIWSQHNGSILGMVAPLIAFALPLLDVGLAICRRFLRSAPIFKGDRRHIHHMVLARGFNPRDASLILYGVCAVATSLALLQSFSGLQFRGAVVIVFICLVIAGVHYLDYAEIGAVGRAISGQRFISYLRDEIYFHDIDRSLARANNAQECWCVVKNLCEEMCFVQAEMRLGNTQFNVNFAGKVEDQSWNLLLPLGGSSYIRLGRSHEEESPRLMMATLDRLQRLLKQQEKKFQGVVLTVNNDLRSRAPRHV